jgi:hypothetical protein
LTDRRTWGFEPGLSTEELAEIERSIRDAQEFMRTGRYLRIEVDRDGDGEVVGWEVPQARGPDTPPCGEPLLSDPGRTCTRFAGAGTDHPGAGPCRWHERRRGRGTGAWIVAHAFATALDVTPWQGLLTAVKIAAGRVAFIEQKLGTAQFDEDLTPSGHLWHWVIQAEKWHERLAKVSKLAIDAGVAERLVQQLELEAQLMLRATSMTLDELGLDADTRQRALGIMSRNLLALEAEENGEVRENDDGT